MTHGMRVGRECGIHVLNEEEVGTSPRDQHYRSHSVFYFRDPMPTAPATLTA